MKVTTTPRTFTIEIDEAFAERLFFVCRSIAGDQEKSSRKYFDELAEALKKAGVKEINLPLATASGAVYFHDEV